MNSEKPPSQRQLRELRRLAERCGESFAYPRTSAEASAEIGRLRRRRPSSRSEVRLERRAVSRDLAWSGGASAVRGSEIVGYGSNCRWLHQTRD